jgi:hypothetical protein
MFFYVKRILIKFCFCLFSKNYNFPKLISDFETLKQNNFDFVGMAQPSEKTNLPDLKSLIEKFTNYADSHIVELKVRKESKISTEYSFK